MDDSDDPYDILGVPRTATLSEIKSAYRKLALRHHPDKAGPDQQAQATVLFSKISNAYEVLSDDQQRRAYDNEAASAAANYSPFDFSHQQDPWHGRSQQNPFASSFFQRHHHQFHDPFQVFEQVFRDELGGGPRRSGMRGPGGSLFDSFFGGGGMMGPMLGGADSFFDNNHNNHMMDPFGRGSMSGGGGGGMMDPFGGFGGGGMGNSNPGGGFTSTYSVSSSTTTSIGGPGGETVTTQTTRKLVNGRQEMVTERIVRKADGTVTRQVLNQGGQPVQQLENERRRTSSRSLPVAVPEHEIIDVDAEETAGAGGDNTAGHKHSRRDSKDSGARRPRKRQEP